MKGTDHVVATYPLALNTFLKNKKSPLLTNKKIHCDLNLFQINNVNFINLFKNKDNIISLSKEQKYFINDIVYTSYQKDKPNILLQYTTKNCVLCNQQKSMTTSPKYYMCDFNHKLLL